ncbi:MAG: HIT family protein [Candidatus Nealsonbacteria bacterium]|nr:HIT family protein [Candidatus Nealsonbacteria bacterium]
MAEFPKPKPGSVFYEDEKCYACLAFQRKNVKGKTIVAWKADVEDLNDLSEKDYQHLMKVVYVVRLALKIVYRTDNVYVACLNEAKHVHWHLFPRCRGGIEGFELMTQPQEDLPEEDLKKVPGLKLLTEKYARLRRW